MQYLHILSFSLCICVYSFKYLQILHIGVKAMKQINRQIKPFGRSTKEDNAGLSLPTPIISNYEISLTLEQKKHFDKFCKYVCISPSQVVSKLVSQYVNEIIEIHHSRNSSKV
jgi:hypothetical protein